MILAEWQHTVTTVATYREIVINRTRENVMNMQITGFNSNLRHKN